MANKTTARENYQKLLSLDAVSADGELVDFLKHQIELLDRKAANRTNKPTERQIQNAQIRNDILDLMEPDQFYTCIDLQKQIPLLDNEIGTHRIGRILSDMAGESADCPLVRKVEKKIIYYGLKSA